MKIGILSQWFDPETGPASLPGVYAREFVRQGHDVQVLTGYPNYPEGRLYPGYKMRLRQSTTYANMRVTRVPLFTSHSRSAVGRVANYASFALAASTFGASALRGVDAIWVYNSPISVALPMLTESRLGDVPVFLHVQDIWPDSLMESGMLPGGRLGIAAGRASRAVVRLMERRAAVIGVISPSVRDLICQRNPAVDPKKIVYVPNPTDEDLFRPVAKLRSNPFTCHGEKEYTDIMYAGAIGDMQGLDAVIEAATLLRSRPDIRFTFVGDGISKSKLEQQVEREGLSSVRFLGRVAQTEVPNLIAQADIQLVSLGSADFLRYTTPSKIASLLASGVPILAHLEGDGANLITQSGAGIAVSPGKPWELAHAVVALVDAGAAEWKRMGDAGRRFYADRMSSASSASKILTSLDNLALREPRRSSCRP